jgi:hypothetical protein
MNVFSDTPAGIDGVPGAFSKLGYAQLEGLRIALFVQVGKR